MLTFVHVRACVYVRESPEPWANAQTLQGTGDISQFCVADYIHGLTTVMIWPPDSIQRHINHFWHTFLFRIVEQPTFY